MGWRELVRKKLSAPNALTALLPKKKHTKTKYFCCFCDKRSDISEQKRENKLLFSISSEFLVMNQKKNRGKSFVVESFVCFFPPRASLSLPIYVRKKKDISNIPKLSNQWSHNKMLIDWFRSGRVARENIWLSIMTHGPRCARFASHDREPNIFRSSLLLSQ